MIAEARLHRLLGAASVDSRQTFRATLRPGPRLVLSGAWYRAPSDRTAASQRRMAGAPVVSQSAWLSVGPRPQYRRAVWPTHNLGVEELRSATMTGGTSMIRLGALPPSSSTALLVCPCCPSSGRTLSLVARD